MKHRLFSQIVSLLVVLSLLLTGSVFPISVTALSDAIDSSNDLVHNDNLVKNDKLLVSDEVILRADDPSIAEESMILKYVDSSLFNNARHTRRLTELEELNTYVFANADGTRSVYMMHENVKYIDKNGVIKEKDISLTNKAGGFGIAQNDIELFIPNNPVQGIDFEYAGFTIKLTPQNLTVTASAVQSDNSIVYNEAYGKNTKLVYTPLLSGVKEDIVLTEYTADAAYTFVLETDGLRLYNDGNRYYLAASGKAEPIFYLGEIVIYDAIGKPDMGTMTVETISEGQKYLLTVIANDEFLSDPTTVYPVTIDPSITVSDSDTSGSIIDAPIFAGHPDRNYGAYTYNRVGTPAGSYGIGRTVVKLSGLTSRTEYQTITANQITNVAFYAREGSGGARQYINLYPLTGNTTWTESSVTWNNIGAYTTSVNYGNTMYGNQWTAFDITDLVKAWKNGTYSADAGFIMTNENEANNKCFCSSEYSNSSYRPYVVMTYEPTFGGGDSFNTAEVITLNTYHTVNIDTPYGKKYFKFVPTSTGFYTFESSSKLSGDPYGELYNSSQTQITYNDDGASGRNFKLTYHLQLGATYYFVAGCYVDYTGIYDLKVTNTSSSSPIAATAVNIGSQATVSLSTPYTVQYFRFTPSADGEYLFTSSGASGDPRVWCYDSSYNYIDSDDDSAGDLNFKLTVALDSGKTYYIVAEQYSSQTGVYTFEAYRSLTYVHYFDSLFAFNATLRNNITTATEFADKVFSTHFGIKINMSSAPTQFATMVNHCCEGDYEYCSDECGLNCFNNHHKNVNAIADEIYLSPREDDHLYVLWTDRSSTTYCYEGDEGHTPFEAIAVVMEGYPVIHFMDVYDHTDELPLACMALVLVHETAHTLGMGEAYEDDEHDNNETVCVMDKFDIYTAPDFYQNVKENNAAPFCNSCKQTIQELAASAVIYGNQ